VTTVARISGHSAFDAPGFEAPIVLYDGHARLHLGDESIDGVGQLSFDWRPTPGVHWRFSSTTVPHSALAAHLQESRLEPLGDPNPRAHAGAKSWSDEIMEGHRFGDAGQQHHGTVIGRAGEFARVEIMVINFVNQIYKDRPTIDVDAGDWHLRVERTVDTDATIDLLRERGGYARTHTAHISRVDGERFGFDEIESLFEATWFLLSFAAGGLVGLALPTGLDEDGVVLGYLTRATSADSYTGRISWLDDFHVDDVAPLFGGWLARVDDPFWDKMLRRAIRLCVSANNVRPLEVSIPVALSCLELLAWAVLEAEERWLDQRDGHLALAGRLRLLLRWADIDPAIPPQLDALTKLAKSDANIPDGPAAIAWVRNRSVHPPKMSKTGEPGWPESEQLHHAWRLAMEYSELVILRLLNHDGDYGSRLHVDGRHWGTVQRVPWADDSQS
jgi:hypothetical protein